MEKKLYLDDERPCPKGWILCRWPEEVITQIKAGNVEAISLDHDLGEGRETINPRTGMDVLNWLEEWVLAGNKPPRIGIHTQNGAKRPEMAKLAMRILNMATHKIEAGTCVHCRAELAGLGERCLSIDGMTHDRF